LVTKHKPLRIGLIGCGGIAHVHVQCLEATGKVTFAGCVEPDDAHFKQFLAKHPALASARRYDDHQALLADAALDGVVICSPHVFHYQQIMDSLDAGVHVLTEKPMVSSVEHALDVVKKADATGLVCMISYQRHFMPQFRWIKRQVESGKLGRLNFVQALQSQQWLRATHGTWRQQVALSCGGQLNDSGSHLVDIVLWTTGLVPDQVFAYIDNLGTEVDILSAISMRATSGTLCNLSIVGHSVNWWEDLTFWFDEATLFVRNGELFMVDASGKRSAPKLKQDGPSSADENFVQAILEGVPPETPAVCGLRVMELTESAWKSGASNQPQQVKHVL